MDNMVIEVELKEQNQAEEIVVIPEKVKQIGNTYYTVEPIKLKLKRRNIVRYSITSNVGVRINDFDTGEIEIMYPTALNHYYNTLSHFDCIRLKIRYRFRNYKGS